MNKIIKTAVFFVVLYCELIYGIYCTCGCVQKKNELLCDNCIPAVIPHGIISVNVTNNVVPMQNHTFSDRSWNNVVYVDITEDSGTTSFFHNGSFSNLISVKYIGLHIDTILINRTQINDGAFEGLNNLNHLNLTNCFRVSFELVYNMFHNRFNFPNLKQLTVSNFNPYGYGSHLNFNKSFMQLLGQRGIESITADGSEISSFYVDGKCLLCSFLKRVSLRNSIVWNIERISLEFIPCVALEFIDVTKTVFPRRGLSSTPIITIDLSDKSPLLSAIYYLASVETAIANNVYSFSIPNIRYIILWETNLTIALKHVSVRGNNVQTVNIEFHTKAFSSLQSLDLGGNKLQYLYPKAFGNFTTIRNLSLDDNELNKMEGTASKDFENMFQYLVHLEKIDLSNNRLTYIPREMFTKNKNLKSVTLSNNKIIQFSQQSVIVFDYLDISYNEISSLDTKSTEYFDSLDNRNLNRTFFVNLTGNSLVCSCKNMSFAKWILSRKYISTDIPKRCRWKDTILFLDNTTIQLLQDDCTELNYDWLYGSLAICLVVTCLTFLARIAFLRFERRNLRHMNRIRTIMQMQNNDFAYQFILYVIFSSRDDEIVLQRIRPLLERAFQNVLGNVPYGLCFGDNEFRPGFGIFDEQERCLKKSAVALAVVSEHFCTSEYTKKEIQMAVDMKKPTILLMIEQVPDNLMFLELRQLFKRNVRAKMEILNGHCFFIPNEEKICQTMLEIVT